MAYGRFLSAGRDVLGHRADAVEELVAGAAVAIVVAGPGWLLSGSTWYFSASRHHSSLISASLSGSRRGEVVHLGEVLGDVVELPHVLVEGLAHVGAVVGDEHATGGTRPPSSRRGTAPGEPSIS